MTMRWTTLCGLTLATLAGCTSDYEVLDLVGGDGELRFNLQFTNEYEVDLDLHVLTPLGEEIYYADKEDSTGGQLDVDCLCGDCPQGPNENIFWSFDSVPPSGNYTVSVVYYSACPLDFQRHASDYTLRFLRGGVVTDTFTGTLDDYFQEDPYSYTYGE